MCFTPVVYLLSDNFTGTFQTDSTMNQQYAHYTATSAMKTSSTSAAMYQSTAAASTSAMYQSTAMSSSAAMYQSTDATSSSAMHQSSSAASSSAMYQSGPLPGIEILKN